MRYCFEGRTYGDVVTIELVIIRSWTSL